LNLPGSLLHSLNGIKGFDKEAFEEAHHLGEPVVSIRQNPFKPLQELSFPDITTTPVPWCPGGFYLSKRPSFTFDPVFHAGAYYVQEASSMFLWEVLKQVADASSPQKILDLCAAPGGKSTLLASFFPDGLVVANEVIRTRVSVLAENITKWGVDNVIVTNNDPKDFAAVQDYFDLIVVDAPCSGSGLFRKDPNALNEWSEENVALCHQRQQRIIADIMPSLKEGGILIYSTCSYSPHENEEVLDWMMEEMGMESVQLKLNENWNITETISPKHKTSGYRFYPDKLQGEGFFIAALKKTGTSSHTYSNPKEHSLSFASKKEVEHIQSFIPLPSSYTIFKQNDFFRTVKEQWLSGLEMLAKHLYIRKAGIELGSIKRKDFVPGHELALSLLPLQSIAMIELDREAALQYLRKKEVQAQGPKGWSLVTHCGLPLGWIKVLPNRVNNYYPSEWRILKD